MLTMHLFPRNIKTPIALPFQWLNITFNILKSNSSSSSSSSDSSSDSDSDTESSKKNKVINNKITDYLYAADIKKKQKRLEDELNRAAKSLLSTDAEEDKERIVSNILNTISYIEQYYQINKSDKSTNRTTQTNHRTSEQRQSESSVIRTLLNQKKEIKSTENQLRQKPELEEEPSVIRTLRNLQQQIESTKNQLRQKPELEVEPSVIRTLRNQQRQIESTENQPRRKPELEEGPSVIRTLRNQQQQIESTENQLRRKPKLEEEPSVIRTLRNQQQQIESSENHLRRKPELEEGPSVIRTLRNQQQRIESTENQFRRKPELEKEPSVIRTLQRQQTSSKHIEEEQSQELFEDIFVNQFTETTAVADLETWNKCEEFELQRVMKQFPKNAFEEMIRWTEEGKLWHFPIDNEQGLEGENDVHFSKHVFLEQHLAEWCPTKGPIRHYMELVCIGLSKNPYMTVNEKIDHIMWYKEYFGNKQDLLKKLGLAA